MANIYTAVTNLYTAAVAYIKTDIYTTISDINTAAMANIYTASTNMYTTTDIHTTTDL